MAICPIANSVGCNKCGMVNFCFLKTVLGNYGNDHMEVGGTIPWKESVESSQERRPRVTPGAVTEEQPGQDSDEDDMTKPKSRPPQ